MSFTCGLCHKPSEQGEKPTVVKKFRTKQYPTSKDQRQEAPTAGRELVKEWKACGACAQKIKDKQGK